MTYFEDRTSSALDDALEMTFPASDPIAVYIPEERTENEESGAACVGESGE